MGSFRKGTAAILFAGISIAAGLGEVPARAESTNITYQGVIRDGNGAPVPNGNYPVVVEIFSSIAGGVPLWTETRPGVSVIDGAFALELGALTPFGSLFELNDELYLEISADAGQGLVTYAPRVPLSAAPYALHAVNADAVGGMTASALEESAEIDADIAAHDADANAHANLALDAAQISSGMLSNARLNMGAGNGLDADTVDGAHAAALEESAEIDADIAAHDSDGNAHADIRAEIDADVAAHAGDGAAHPDIRAEIDADVAAHAGDGAAHPDIRAEIDTDIAAHDADANAHPNMEIDAAQIATGIVANARLSMGPGNGLDADTLDGVHAAALEESAEIDADIAAHNVDAGAHANMNVAAGQIVSGTLDIARLPVGTGGGQVSPGNHTHDASAITGGTIDIARLPLGTGATQVAVGNHTHNALSGPGGSNPNTVFVDGAGQVGIGTTAPGAKLELNGMLKFTGDPGAAQGYSGGMVRSPRVLRVCDPRPGCPNGTAVPDTTDLWGQSFTLSKDAAIFATCTLIKFGTGRRDLGIYIDGAEGQRAISDTGASASPVSVVAMWTGVLGAGNHRISVGVSNIGNPPTTWGCGCGHGQLDILILE